MAALDSNALLIQYGNVSVGSSSGDAVDLGAVRNVRFTAVQERTRVESDNRGTLINKVRLRGRVEFDWLEPGDATKMEALFKGIVTRTTVAASIVNNHSQVVASGSWNYDKIIFLDNQDGDGTNVNIDSVTLGTDGAIVLNTDYFVVKDPATLKWGIVIRDSSTVTTEAQSVTIQYDYTPAASQVLTGGTSQTATNRYMKIDGPSEDDSSVTRTIEISECTVTSDMLVAFLDVEQAGDVGVMPVAAESNKGTTWTITDEINAN